MTFTASLPEIVEKNHNGLLGKHSSWERVSLSEVARILNGCAFASNRFNKVKGMPLLRIRDVLKDSTDTLYDGDYDPLYVVNPDELVIGMDGDFNSSLWKGPPALLNQRVCKVTPQTKYYNLKFLSYALPGYLSAINEATSSITVKHLSSFTVSEILLPLPPIQEQHRIVEEIEKQFSRLDAGVAALKRTLAKLKRYRATVLQSACEGRLVPTEAELARAEGQDYEPADALLHRILTERRAKWEADQLAKMEAQGKPPKDEKWKTKYVEPNAPVTSNLPLMPEGWSWTNLETVIVSGPQNGLYLPQSAYGGGTPILRIDDYQIGWSRGSDELRRVKAQLEEVEDFSLTENDIVVNRVNSLTHLGKALLITAKNLPALFESNMMRLRLAENVCSRYIEIYLHSDQGRLRLISDAKWAVNQASINQKDVARTPVPLPPISEQQRIVAEVERRLSIVEGMEAAVTANLKRAERLRQAILKRAFAGQLVPQDPNDEPASVLLERIRAERDATSPNGAKRTTRRKKDDPQMELAL